MQFNILTLFPEMIKNYSNLSILRRGQNAGIISIRTVNPRDFTTDKHKTVDDTPYGGGAGMVMKPEPIYAALKSIDAIPFAKMNGIGKLKKIFTGELKKKKHTVVLSPRGRQFDQCVVESFTQLDELTLVCGRYEGIDQRVIDYMIDEEISVGPYVLAGGELGALVIVEAVSRLLPGVLGNPDSLNEETFGNRLSSISQKQNKQSQNLFEYAQYTKPADFKGWKVPDVLLSGDHKKIADWRNCK